MTARTMNKMTAGNVTRDELVRDIELNKETVDEMLYGFLSSISSLSDAPLIREIIEYGALPCSLRERSFLINLITKHYGGSLEEVKELCIAAELLNASTFFIDDILDDGRIRENKPAVWVKYGLKATLNAHEVLRSLCHGLVSGFCAKPFITKDQALVIVEEFNRIFHNVYVGQQLDIESVRRVNFSEDDYFQIVELSSGSQFAGICKIAALAAGAPQIEADALTSVGLKFALCAQIRDDIIELLGDGEVIGKELGVDLKAGRPRLPIIIYLKEKKKRFCELTTDTTTLREVGSTALPFVMAIGERIKAEALDELEFIEPKKLYRYFEALMRLVNTY